MSVAKEGDFIEPENAAVGDILVLTKPLGTQVAVNVNEWILYNGPNWVDKASKVISEEEALRGYDAAMRSMARLNKTGAKLMHTYKAHGATDVTGTLYTQHNTQYTTHIHQGFGYLGHANNLAYHQKAKVDFVLEVLPIIKGMKTIDDAIPGRFNLQKGFSSETSGGLLVCLPSLEAAEGFCRDIEKIDGAPAWIVGRVVEGNNKARIAADAKVIEV